MPNFIEELTHAVYNAMHSAIQGMQDGVNAIGSGVFSAFSSKKSELDPSKIDPPTQESNNEVIKPSLQYDPKIFSETKENEEKKETIEEDQTYKNMIMFSREILSIIAQHKQSDIILHPEDNKYKDPPKIEEPVNTKPTSPSNDSNGKKPRT